MSSTTEAEGNSGCVKKNSVVSVLRKLVHRLHSHLKNRPNTSVFAVLSEETQQETETSALPILNENCLLHIASMLDNKDRRHLSQACKDYRMWIERRSSSTFDTRKQVNSVMYLLDGHIPYLPCENIDHAFHSRSGLVSYSRNNRGNTLLELYLQGKDYEFQRIIIDMCTYWCGGHVVLRYTPRSASLPSDAVFARSHDQLVTLSEKLFVDYQDMSSLLLSIYCFSYILPGVDRLITGFMKSPVENLKWEVLNNSTPLNEFIERSTEVALQLGWCSCGKYSTEEIDNAFWDIYSFTQNQNKKAIMVPTLCRDFS